MLNRVIRRTVAVATTLAVCGLLAACGGGDGETEKNVAMEIDPLTMDTASEGSGDSITVVFQFTGMLLAVPPKQQGGPMDVLIPTATHDSVHAARLGFGGDSTAVCEKYYHPERICYVDLAKWTVAAIGSGGSPTNLKGTKFPHGVVNVTRGAGNIHHPKLPPDANEVTAHVQFLTGAPIGTPCSLANWRYGAVSQTAQPHRNPPTLPLTNVMNWGIKYPRNQPFHLVFTQKDTPAVVDTVTLVTAETVYVVLANIPTNELRYLPPHVAVAATDPPDSLVHFHDFYKLLRREGTNDRPEHAYRPLPRYDTAGQPDCRVRISTTVFDKSTNRMRQYRATGGVKTYGCVVGSGGG